MKDIYLLRDDIERYIRPKKETKLQVLEHPEIMFNKCEAHMFPDNIQSSFYGYSGVIVKLLLTNETHDGIWLTVEDDKEKVSIPGGHMSQLEWERYQNDPKKAIYKTLIRELMEEHRYYRAGMEDYTIDKIDNIYDELHYMIKQYGFKSSFTTFPMLYNYELESHLASYTIYILAETNNPESGYVTPPSYGYKQSVWYSRVDHRMNHAAYSKSHRESIFQTQYKNDIRITDRGMDILDTIFNTESVFGKWNIY